MLSETRELQFPRGGAVRLIHRGLVVGLFVAAPAAGAEPGWLDWTPGPECPAASYVEERVAEWLGGPVAQDVDLVVSTQVSRLSERWRVTVGVAFEGHSGTRQVTVRDCREAADFVALAVALAVDPSLAATVSPTSEADAPAHGAPSDEAPAEPSAPTTGSGTRPAEAEARPPEMVAVREASRRWLPHLSGSLEGNVGVLPEPALGAEIQGGADLHRWSLSLGGFWLAPRQSAPERAVAPIDFSLLGARAKVSYQFLGPVVWVAPLVSLGAGWIRAEQVDWGAVYEPWLALCAGALGSASLGPRFRVLGETELVVPMTRPSFVLDDGTEVDEVGLGVRASLGVRFFLAPE